MLELLNSRLIEHFGLPERNRRKPEPLDLLIATILSQNTNDNNSYEAYLNLKQKFPNWSKLAKSPLGQIEKAIRKAGLTRQKARTIKNLVVNLSKENRLDMNFLKKMKNEEALEFLTSFKGVGVKTASCVLLFSLYRNVCPVDTHVHRTLNRIGIVNEKSPDKTFQKINENLPDGIAHSLHTNLIKLGREICRPTNPDCTICPVADLCAYPEKNNNRAPKRKKSDFLLLDNV
ncbi:endonuclease III domain-containing protein [Melioribacter sp. OK-6-Me]|uniref:endonuclease III domain-containing protein n=1 Tax=unclassified Melioribacter TaxID=2627329 RepID=UPI003EDB2643